MHIGFICSEYPPTEHGGIGTVTRDLAEGLVQAGHRATVVGVEHGRTTAVRETIAGVAVLRLASTPDWLRCRPRAMVDRFRLHRAIARLHHRTPLDLVECPDYAGWLPRGTPARIPLVVRLHGSNLFFDTAEHRPGDRFERTAERRTLARADCWLAVSRYVAERTAALCDGPVPEPVILPNAVDTDRFRPGETDATECGLVVCVNSVTPRKGATELVQAMNRVLETCPQASLTFVGRHAYVMPDGRTYREHLRGLASPALRARLSFVGHVHMPADVVAWLRKANVCCFPSHSESFGLGPVEAMAVGRATVYMQAPPGPEVVKDGVTGLLADTRDPGSIAAALVRLLSDSALVARLGKAGREHVLQQFDRHAWLQRNIARYRRFCPAAAPP